MVMTKLNEFLNTMDNFYFNLNSWVYLIMIFIITSYSS